MLYPQVLPIEASPKAISRSTSYFRVRLAFHPYPQFIPCLFNDSEFEPPVGFTPPSLCPWVDHTVSGLQHATSRPLQTRFRFGSKPPVLNLAAYHNSLVHSTKGTPPHEVRGARHDVRFWYSFKAFFPLRLFRLLVKNASKVYLHRTSNLEPRTSSSDCL